MTLSFRSSSTLSVAAVVASHNEGEHLCDTIHALLATMPADSGIVVVDDFSTDCSTDFIDGSYPSIRLLKPNSRLGAARARNFGARNTAAEVLIFLDAHVRTPQGWVDDLLAALVAGDVGAVGPAVAVMGNPIARGYGFTWSDTALTCEWLPRAEDDPYTVPMLGAFCLGIRRAVFEECGGFDDGLVGWGGEDAELSLHLWTRGYECKVVPSVAVEHLFKSQLAHLERPESVILNYLRLAAVHLSGEAFKAVTRQFQASPLFADALAGVLESDFAERREAVRDARVRDDSDFFERFNVVPFANLRSSTQ